MMNDDQSKANDKVKVIAARHICEEASKVLSQIRRGPPLISRGSLVHNLRELRTQVKSHFLDPDPRSINNIEQIGFLSMDGDGNGNGNNGNNGNDVSGQSENDNDNDNDNIYSDTEANASDSVSGSTTSESVVIVGRTKSQDLSSTASTEPATLANSEIFDEMPQQQFQNQHHPELVQVGAFAQPFLDIILDPRAAGPHTLIALRSLHRLISRHSLTLTSSSTEFQNNNISNAAVFRDFKFEAEMEPLMRGILECRFEQTNAGADEAVEMAIADLLSLIVSLDINRVMNAEVIMEAFNTVFVTRNTFVHSPALCYHFEQVLDGIIRDLFANLHILSPNGENHCATAAKLIIEFLVSQLLHTPMIMEDAGNIMSPGSMEAYAMHNDTRVLCLRLIQTCLKIGWGEETSRKNETKSTSDSSDNENVEGNVVSTNTEESSEMEDGILKTIQDDLCLSLLLVGQGIWAYQDPSSGALPGIISMEVLSEICSTLSTLWSISVLRNILTTQFENIFTGFYQRALSLLRRIPVPHDSATFHANQIFDAEVEIILESLVDILSLHSDDNDNGNDSIKIKSKGAIEALFVMYDCNMNRPDVAAGLVEELSRCCGGNINEVGENDSPDAGIGASKMSTSASSGSITPVRQSSIQDFEPDHIPLLRDVPAHLKELCAEALSGVMRTLFSNPSKIQMSSSEDALLNKSLRSEKKQKVLMRKAVELFNEKASSGFKFLVANGLIAEPVTPSAIASFLRNGIVLGLNKKAVGEYLGTKGKSPVAGKSPPDWERDWFHKEALLAYCSSFHFKNQSLLDGLRMFLAAFRLPGEAQQIDRILQAFAESCGLQCEESPSGSQRLFSNDPKKASDGAYLLSFSIIMLNTDLHNDNIRPDRKMKVEDFVKNNTDYGRDITDPDKKLPSEYLEGIYARIKDEQIRTEGEGADGVMTFERWKDVMRNLGDSSTSNQPQHDSNVTDLVMEIVQYSIFSAIRGFWGVSLNGKTLTRDHPQSGMFGVQGARFGMDLAIEAMTGLKSSLQKDLFQDFYIRICYLTGLLGDYKTDAVERTLSFVDSLERQSAVVVVMKIASECGDYIGSKGWVCVLRILFELRDLKLLGGGTHIKHRSLIIESDPDLLRSDARRDWEMRLVKQCYEVTGGKGGRSNQKGERKSGLFGAMGRAFFGSESTENLQQTVSVDSLQRSTSLNGQFVPSDHGKEELVLWDDLAPSDEEDDFDTQEEDQQFGSMHRFSLGSEFENQLVKEDKIASQPAAVTGLETYEDTRVYQVSPRARVRKRLLKLCDFSMILSETRFLDLEGVKALLNALIEIIDTNHTKDPSNSEGKAISPASEALAEVMITEIALKNRDRIAALWSSCLKPHYERRLALEGGNLPNRVEMSVKEISGIEKHLTGILRICYHTVHRDGVNNEVLQTLKLLCPYIASFTSPLPLLNFNKHIAEGLWRICRDVDGLLLVGVEGWGGILDLIQHCARGGEPLILQNGSTMNNISDDDPALQAFRCMHLMLHSTELRDVIPFQIVHSVRALINGGERQNCPKLSLAGLDLLQLLLTRLHLMTKCGETVKTGDNIWNTCWLPIIEGMAEASDSKFPATRQHSMAMFRDALIDKYSEDAPVNELCRILNGICMPIASQRISELVQHQVMLSFDKEEILIELELCISTIFKPFLHHLDKLSGDMEELAAVWMSLLSILSHLLGKDSSVDVERKVKNGNLLKATKDLATERLRDSVMILISRNILKCDEDSFSKEGKNISFMTWNAISNITYCKHLIPEWKESANKQVKAV